MIEEYTVEPDQNRKVRVFSGRGVNLEKVDKRNLLYEQRETADIPEQTVLRGSTCDCCLRCCNTGITELGAGNQLISQLVSRSKCPEVTCVASTCPRLRLGGETGARHLRFPIGASAYRMPRYDVIPDESFLTPVNVPSATQLFVRAVIGAVLTKPKYVQSRVTVALALFAKDAKASHL